MIRIVTASVGFMLALPGLMYVASDATRRLASSRRYVTYDPEFFLFGISLTPATAQALALGVVPLMFALSVFLVLRGLRRLEVKIDPGSKSA